MNWTVILTACIIFAIFVGPFILVSRKHSSNQDPDNPDQKLEQEKPRKHAGKGI